MPSLQKLMLKHDACVQVFATTRGFTVRAHYWKDAPADTYKDIRQKRWVGIKEGPVADHKRTGVFRSVDEAMDWLEKELKDA